jgi:hypothetical protein
LFTLVVPEDRLGMLRAPVGILGWDLRSGVD